MRATANHDLAAHNQYRFGRLTRSLLLYLVAIAGAFIMVVPLLYMLSTAFMPNQYVLQTPPVLIPTHPTFDNFVAAWSANNFGGAFLNSVIVATTATVITVLLSSMLAFAFGRYRFPGRTLLFYLMLATMTVPGTVLVIPQFVMASRLQLTNSLWGLIIVYSAGMALSVYLLKGFFEEMPQDLFDAAAIDGCGVFQSFFRIALPLARPALAAVAIFAFSANWDEFTWAITSINDDSLYTLPVAIEQFYSNHATNWGVVFAATTIAVIPMILVFLLLQRYFVSGIAGAMKG
ncbi:MAG TPA: carbohydrate ABC transporter permease [Ktedonobacterales bacterium]|nr:carbohydrate ABC transporter permease [Ktedonobacterales bacterium]